MLHILTSRNNRDNDDIEGFGYRWDSDEMWGNWKDRLSARGIGINGGSTNNSRTVSFKPLFGILNSNSKYIPLAWCPIQMEFEIINDAKDAICFSNCKRCI